ncbi:50S ribosomal protein L4 [Candidatus Nomurabacteria bacterium]|nr:50S ribosomal protein L4 [Candidatus Nomurabacteria bacterium]
MESKIYNQAAKEVGTTKLSARVFGLPWNGDLVHQVVVGMQSNARQNTAHTKGRGEVRGGGKKPWRQKGTGRARHGSIRSPIWRGGGTTHGPTNERNYEKKINKKMKTKALFTALSQKQRDGEVVFVDQFKFAKSKTREAQKSLDAFAKVKGLEKLNYRRGQRTLLALPAADKSVWQSFRNLPGVAVSEIRNLNPELLLNYQYLLITSPEVSLPLLEGREKAKK